MQGMWRGDDGNKCDDFDDGHDDADDSEGDNDDTCSSTPPSFSYVFFSRVIPRKADIH